MGKDAIALSGVILQRGDRGLMDRYVPGFAKLRLSNDQNSSLKVDIPIFQCRGFPGPQSRSRKQTN
jgi:hypothetical protein